MCWLCLAVPVLGLPPIVPWPIRMRVGKAIEPEIGARIRAGRGHESLGNRRVEQWIDGRV